MKKLEDFDLKKVEIDTIYGGIDGSVRFASNCNTVTLYSDGSSQSNDEDDSGWAC